MPPVKPGGSLATAAASASGAEAAERTPRHVPVAAPPPPTTKASFGSVSSDTTRVASLDALLVSAATHPPGRLAVSVFDLCHACARPMARDESHIDSGSSSEPLQVTTTSGKRARSVTGVTVLTAEGLPHQPRLVSMKVVRSVYCDR